MRLRSCTAALFLAATMVAALAGCGGDDDEGTPSGGGGGRTAVTVQDVAGIPSEFLGAGVKQGFFSKRGLDVTVKTAAGGAAIIPAVVSGGPQFGGSNVVSVLIAATKGLPIHMVAAGTFGPQAEKDDGSAVLVIEPFVTRGDEPGSPPPRVPVLRDEARPADRLLRREQGVRAGAPRRREGVSRRAPGHGGVGRRRTS